MKKIEKLLFLWATLLLMSLFVGCSGGDSDEGDVAIPFETIPTSTTSAAKDFKMNDIDALVDLSLKMEGLRLQYAKMMSNGWTGELYSGPGKNTNGQKFYDYVADLLDNAEQYQAALKRLETDGILTSPTVTRGLMLDFANWCYSLNAPKEVAYERMLTILNKMKATGSMTTMQALFNHVPVNHRCGMTDAKQWFLKLYAGDFKNKCMSIHDTWLTAGEGEGNGPVAEYFDTYEALYDNGPGNPRWKDAHEIVADVATKGGAFYVSCIDEVTGGYVGKWVDINDISEETVRLAKKIREGKATTSDLKKFAATLGSKYVKDKSGDIIGEGMTADALNRLAGEITDFATTHAIETADEEIAKGMGINLYEIQKTTGPGVAVTIIEDVKAGNITIGFPGKDGNTRIVTKPGDKNITVVTTDETRITQQVPEQKPGKIEVEAAPKEKATVKVTPETVDVVATGGKVMVEMASNCPYYRYRFNGDKPDWFTVKRSGKTLIIDVTENTSDKPRTAQFLAEVSFEGRVADASATVTVTQAGFKKEDDRPMIEADKTELDFDANGGQQTVKLDVKTYQYYGGIVDDDSEEWLSVKSNGSDVTLTVTATANKTGSERMGTVYAFATNKEKIENEEDYVLLPITVKQAAEQQDDVQLEYLTLDGAAHCIRESDNWVTGGSLTNTTFKPEEVTITTNGNGLHFEAHQVYTKEYSDNSFTITTDLSFDLPLGWLREGPVTNVSLYQKSDPKIIALPEDWHGRAQRVTNKMTATDLQDRTSESNFRYDENGYLKSYYWFVRRFGGQQHSTVTSFWREEYGLFNQKYYTDVFNLDPTWTKNYVVIVINAYNMKYKSARRQTSVLVPSFNRIRSVRISRAE